MPTQPHENQPGKENKRPLNPGPGIDLEYTPKNAPQPATGIAAPGPGIVQPAPANATPPPDRPVVSRGQTPATPHEGPAPVNMPPVTEPPDEHYINYPPQQGIAASRPVVEPGQPEVAAGEITALNPNTAPANADVTINITGTGFGEDSTVNIGSAHSLVPESASDTDLSVVVEAVNIAAPGVLPVSVKNKAGVTSNSMDFTVT